MYSCILLLACVAATAADISFLVVGDWGDNEFPGRVRQKFVAQIMHQYCSSNPCDFIISTGDNFYEDGVDSPDSERFENSWSNVYTGRSIRDLPWYMSLGNHDHKKDNEDNQLEYAKTDPRWVMPNYYYDFTITDESTSAVFYALDTQSLRKDKHDPEKQLEELEEVMCGSNSQWKVAFGHHPPLSVGSRWGDETVLETVVPILERCNVDFLITGHDHNLQHIVHATDHTVDYVVSGAAGRNSNAFDGDNLETIEDLGYESRFFSETYGFVAVTMTEKKVTTSYYDYAIDTDDLVLRRIYTFHRDAK